jgi:hypothetical protein
MLNGASLLLYSSTNSSFAPFVPRKRISLMRIGLPVPPPPAV